MAACDLPSPGVENASAAALHQLKEMLQGRFGLCTGPAWHREHGGGGTACR